MPSRMTGGICQWLSGPESFPPHPHSSRKKEEYAYYLTLQMGKLINEARADVDLSTDIVDYYAKKAEEQRFSVWKYEFFNGLALYRPGMPRSSHLR